MSIEPPLGRCLAGVANMKWKSWKVDHVEVAKLKLRNLMVVTVPRSPVALDKLLNLRPMAPDVAGVV